MKKTRGFLLAAAAMFLTFSCSSGDDSGGGTCSTNFKTVRIGTQIWMAENLNCDAKGSVCYDGDPANCERYGRLYNRKTALTICPKGWHLPSEAEWDILINYAGDSSTAGIKLKATGGWNEDDDGVSGNGTDDHDFSALPGGMCTWNGGLCSHIGNWGYWWTTTESGSSGSDNRAIGGYGANSFVSGHPGFLETDLISVRCVKD